MDSLNQVGSALWIGRYLRLWELGRRGHVRVYQGRSKADYQIG